MDKKPKESKLTLVYVDSEGSFIDCSPFQLEQDGTPLDILSNGDYNLCKYVGFRVQHNDETIEVFE